MVVWSGFGWVVMACAVAGVLIVNGFFLLFGVTKGMPLHHYESGFSAITAGLVVFAADALLARHRRPRRMLDLETKEEVALERKDTFFFMPVRWWGIILPLLGAWFIAERNFK